MAKRAAKSRKKTEIPDDTKFVFIRDDEIRQAVDRLDEIYRESRANEDDQVALNAVKEKNKLLGLYPTVGSETPDESHNEESDALAAVRGYLMPLELGGEETSTVELARLAALKLTELM